MENANIILTAEESFAREVALAVIVKHPPSLYYSLIPGMFIFDFLKRTAAVRKYTHQYMFPRKLALRNAQDIVVKKSEKKTAQPPTEKRVTQHFVNSNRFSPGIVQSQMAVIALLTNHYAGLIEAKGIDFPALLRYAYQDYPNYQNLLEILASAENDFLEALFTETEISGPSVKRMNVEQKEVESRRQRYAEEIFYH